MAKKLYEESNIAAIATKIREKTGTETTYKTAEMPAGVEVVYDAGKETERDAFWEFYQKNGTRRYYQNAFYGDGWADGNYFPKYDIKAKNANNAFYNNQLTDIKVTVDFTNTGFTGAGNLFSYSYSLKRIPKIIVDANTVYTTWFTQCTALEDVTFEGTIGQNGLIVSDCPLTHDSLMSIINCLENKPSGTWTVTLGTTNLAKLTDAEKAIATEKGWTLA